MSAIAAIFNLDGAPANEQDLHSMTNPVSHRGPDGIGTWTSGPVGLASCLLKNTPEASFEKLPLVVDEGRYAVALDGRIDNRLELAGLLKIEASVLPTVPDSEIVLAAYRKWGNDCLSRVVGDFAVVIWDSALREFFCGRDPVGVRLLHYYCDGKRFIAATEVAQIKALVNPGLDEEALALFLGARNLPADGTFMKGVKKLPGGCQMTVSTSGPNLEVYWNPDPSEMLVLRDAREYEEQFLALFKDSVKARLRGSAPAAVSLSGGMDSTSVIALAEHMRQSDSPELSEIRYFSNVYSDLSEVDESEYIKATVDMYGTPGMMIESGEFDDESFSSSPLGLKRAEPYIAPHEENHRRLFTEAQKSGARSLLTGLGGDEVFTVGYGFMVDRFRKLDLRSIRREWRYFTRRQWLLAGLDALRSLVPIKSEEEGDEPAAWLSSSARSSIASVEQGSWYKERKYRSHHLTEVEDWIQKRGGLAGYTWTDVTAAEYGLEPSHPFMDRRIVEYLASVPPEVKFRHGYTKRVLRRAMKGILPEVVRNRRYKTNFSAVYDVKTTQSQAASISEMFKSPLLAEIGMVDPAPLQNAWSEYQLNADHVDNERRTDLWVAITLERWLRDYVVDDGSENENGAFPSQRGSTTSTLQVVTGGAL